MTDQEEEGQGVMIGGVPMMLRPPHTPGSISRDIVEHKEMAAKGRLPLRCRLGWHAFETVGDPVNDIEDDPFGTMLSLAGRMSDVRRCNRCKLVQSGHSV